VSSSGLNLDAQVAEAKGYATDAASSAAAAEAVGDTNDAIMTGVVTDTASATRGALDGVFAPGGSAGNASIDDTRDAADQGQPTSRRPTVVSQVPTGGQDITNDAATWYQGHNNGVGVNSTIRKIDPSAPTIVAASFVGPPHCSSLNYAPVRRTLLASSGSGETPVVWELDTDGTRVRTWDFSPLGLVGILVAPDDTDPSGNRVWLFTRSTGATTYAYDVRRPTLADDGTYSDADIISSVANNGTGQGLVARDGYAYLLTDDPLLPARRVSRFVEAGGVIVQDRTWVFDSADESEGIMFWAGDMCYGSGDGYLYTAPYQPLNDQVVAESVAATGQVQLGLGSLAPVVISGVGNPTGLFSAPPGSMFLRTDASAGHGLYIKESGTDSQGWSKVTTTSAIATTLVSDAFDRADSTTTLGVADTGQTWEVPLNATGSQPVAGIIGGTAYFPTPQGDGIALTDATQADVVVEITIVAAHSSAGPVVRAQDGSNGYFANMTGLYRRVAGVQSDSATWAMYWKADRSALVAGDRCRIMAAGDTIVMYYQPGAVGDWIASPTAIIGSSKADGGSMFNTATKHGFHCNASTGRFGEDRVTSID
jgi:hypothetical protein